MKISSNFCLSTLTTVTTLLKRSVFIRIYSVVRSFHFHPATFSDLLQRVSNVVSVEGVEGYYTEFSFYTKD